MGLTKSQSLDDSNQYESRVWSSVTTINQELEV